MRILSNKKIKRLFIKVLSGIIVFMIASAVLAGLNIDNAALYIMIAAFCMGAFILLSGYRYFKWQYKLMENAVNQIKAYTSGDETARIECDEEGELYILFHEVNTLVSILNAHTEKEKRTKLFLKNTLSDISHQLKTPIAALNIYNGIIQEEAKALPTIKEFSSLSEQELDRMETLVQNLLKITKLDAGSILMVKLDENISDMMNDIKKRFQYRIEEEGKTLTLKGDESITLFCDRGWFMEAIGNIVKNALDHTEKSDSISIEWRESASVIQIIIRDNGSGIHEEDLYFIFKRFYRSRFSKDTQGTGLGLSLAKSIIQAHNGTIRADSELNVGTVFTIEFLIPAKL